MTAVRWKPAGSCSVSSPWLIQTARVWGRPANKRRGGVFDGDFGVAVFALGAGADLAAEVMDDEVQAVTDAEGGKAELEHLGIGGRGVCVIDRGGSAGEDDADGVIALDFGDGNGAGQDDGEDVELADAARDELGVLRAEVENNDCLGVHVLVWQEPEGDVKTANRYRSDVPSRIAIAGLQELDPVSSDAIDDAMFLRDAPAPAAGQFVPQWFRLADAAEGLGEDGFYQAENSQSNFSICLYPVPEVFTKPVCEYRGGIRLLVHGAVQLVLSNPTERRNSFAVMISPPPLSASWRAWKRRWAFLGERNRYAVSI